MPPRVFWPSAPLSTSALSQAGVLKKACQGRRAGLPAWCRARAPGVEADHVGGAVGGALGTADVGAGERVHLVEAQLHLGGVMHHGEDREHADAVGDEVGGVLGAHDALPSRVVSQVSSSSSIAASVVAVRISSTSAM